MSDIRSVRLVLRGKPGTPLVIRHFSDKAREEIRIKQQKGARKAKAARDPEAEYQDAKYLDADGHECVPIAAIKKSMVSAVTSMQDLTKVGVRQAIFLSPTANPGGHLAPIETLDGTPAVGAMREDAVTIGVNTRGLAYRPEYREWQLRVTVEFNSRLLSEAQVLTLAELAGWGVGICEGRPEKTSALGWGRFEVAKAE